jgi:hypothetical protein
VAISIQLPDLKPIKVIFLSKKNRRAEVLSDLAAYLNSSGFNTKSMLENTKHSEVRRAGNGEWVVNLFFNKNNEDDFPNSKIFYALCSKGKSRVKILIDKYSLARGELLFPILRDLEIALRNVVAGKITDYKLPSGFSPRNGDEDHKLAQIDLFTLCDAILFAPCRSGFYEERLNVILGSGFDEDRLRAELLGLRKLKFWDEVVKRYTIERTEGIAPPVASEVALREWDKIRKVRNNVMHYKVITPAEMKEAEELIAKNKDILIDPDVGKIMREYVDNLKSFIVEMKNVTSIDVLQAYKAISGADHARSIQHALGVYKDSVQAYRDNLLRSIDNIR